MSPSSLFSKSVTKASLFAGAVASTILIASALPHSGSLGESRRMQMGGSQIEATQPSQGEQASLLAISLGGGAAAYFGWNAFANRRQALSTAYGSARAAGQTEPNSALLGQTNRSLQRKLLLLLHEDRSAANRLLKQAYLKYPGKTANWCAEKVIYDLQRDRGKI